VRHQIDRRERGNLLNLLVPLEGLEPPRPCEQQILSLLKPVGAYNCTAADSQVTATRPTRAPASVRIRDRDSNSRPWQDCAVEPNHRLQAAWRSEEPSPDVVVSLDSILVHQGTSSVAKQPHIPGDQGASVWGRSSPAPSASAAVLTVHTIAFRNGSRLAGVICLLDNGSAIWYINRSSAGHRQVKRGLFGGLFGRVLIPPSPSHGKNG
jgi:hypothetical protein